MRPDQHKKKRSARYKKKHGIQNDKTSTSAKSKGSEKTATSSKATGQDETENADAIGIAKQVGQAQEVSTTTNVDGEMNITPSFSRRKIESNWDRYEGLPDDDEAETVTSRGVQFNRLLSETGHAEAQFRFKDEQSWEEDETLASEAVSKLLSVDVEALTKHIKAIPIPERLGIVRCFFEDDLLKKFDREAEENSLSVKGVHSKITQSSHSVSSSKNDLSSNTNDPTLKTATKEALQKEHQKTEDLKESLKSSLSARGAFNSAQVKGHEGTHDMALEDTKTSTCNLEDISKNVQALPEDVSGTGDDADDELDFLLSLENPVQVKGQSDGTSDAVEGGDKADSCEAGDDNSTKTEELPKSPVLPTAVQQSATAVQDGTDNLEDWLDDMLDD